MTNEEFVHIQDNVLQLSGRELAEKLCVSPAAVSRWREEREIPPYIVELLKHLQAEHFQTLTLPLTIPEIISLSRLAEERGETVESILISLIRSAITPGEPTPSPARKLTYNPEEIASSRLNELDTPSP